MRAQRLIGRQRDISALRAAVDAALAGAGSVMLLAGEPGIGKTALVTDAAEYARDRGATVAWAACWEGDGAPGYWPWIQVVRALSEPAAKESASREQPSAAAGVLAGLTGPAGGAGEGPGAGPPSGATLGGEAAARFRAFDMTVTYLRELAARQPLVVVLDDLHWSDLSSLRLLSFLARQVHDAAVLVIGTYRDVELAVAEHPARPLLAELAGQAQVLTLTGLAAAETAALLALACGQQPSDALAAAMHERTAGNPFFVHEIARLLAARGVALDDALGEPLGNVVPPAVADVIERQFARLPSDVAGLLGMAAVLGKRFGIDEVAALAQRPLVSAAATGPASAACPPPAAGAASTAKVLFSLEAAARAGIVVTDDAGGARFTHDLLREVAYAGLPAVSRSALHLAVAQLLEEPGGPAGNATRIAHHRVAALPLGDRDAAASALLTAAREAAARTALDEAAALVGRAVAIAGGPGVAAPGVVCRHAEALRRAGNGDDARAAFRVAARRARALGDAGVLARAAFGLHRVPTLTDSSRSDVIALLEEAIVALTGTPADPSRERAGPPAAADGGTRWLVTAALARELTDGPGSDRSRAATLAATAVGGARTDAARSAGAPARAARAALAYALFAQCDVRWEPGSAGERLQLADELAVAATAAGETELLLEAHLARLAALLELGDARFEAQVDAFTRLAEDTAIPHYVYLARSRRATLASLTGPFQRAERLIAEAAAYGERIAEPDTWAVQASQLVGLAMLRGGWTSASALAAARGKPLTPPEVAVHEQAWLAVEAGDPAIAARLVATLPERPAAYRWRQAALLTADAALAAAVGDLARSASLYDQLLPMAGEWAVVASAVFTTGPVALHLGVLAAALGRREDAVRHLEVAVGRCDRLGARLHADRARAELERVRVALPSALAGQPPRASGHDSAVGPGGEQPNEFRRDGEAWLLTFGGRTASVRDVKGMRDLAVLLASPGQEIAATDLAAGSYLGETAASPARAQVPLRGGTPVPAADPVLDERARAEYRARLAFLDGELAAADARQDADRSALLAAERDALIAELSRAVGLGGRPRRLGDAAERARTTVTARIRDAIGRVERAHPELGAHLRATFFTGARCAYRPAQTIRWHVSRS